MWDIPFLSLNQTNTLTYIMFISSTCLEPKSQLTINLALKRNQKRKEKKGKKKREKEKVPNQKSEESKRKKIPDQGSEENRGNMHKGLWTRQHLNNTELSPSKQKIKETTI